MATIDSKKLLPAGKPGSSIVESQKPLLIPVNNVIFKKDVKISQKLLKPADEEKDSGGSLVVIRKKVLKISDVINSTYLIEQSENNRKRKERERQKSEEREKKLETRKPTKADEKNLAKLSLPGGSILDTIKRFLGFTLLGYLFDKYNQFLPKLVEFTKLITPVAQFIETFAKNAVNSVINFIDLGYRAYDSVNKMIKDVGGEGAAKQFEQFSTEFNKLLNGAIAAAMLVASTAPRSPGGVAGGLGANASRGMGGAVPKPTSGFGAGTAMTPGRYRLPGQAKAGGSFNSQLARKGLTFEQSVAAQQASKQASKQVAKQSLKSLVAVPVIGALIGFIIDTVVFREKPSRAAAGAIGSAIGQGIGIALAGSTTFGLGAGIGMFVGGFAGDWLGKTIYDGLTGFKPAPTEARAQGGQVSGGQSRVSPTRRIRTTQARQRRSYVPQKTQPGKDVGGKQKIEQLYGKDEPGKRSALRALRKSSEDLKKMRSLNGVAGAMFGAGIDMSLGQKPDKKLAASLGNTFGSVIQAAVDAELDSSFNDISKTIAMANGGVVPSREIKGGMSIGEKIGKYISNAFSIALESSASKVLQNLNQEFNLEGGAPGGMDGGAGGGGPGAGTVSVSSDSPDFWLLSVGSLLENSHPQGAADVAQVIYNRVSSPSWPSTIRDVILEGNGGQFQPVRDYGNISAWRGIKDKKSALDFIRKYGKGRTQSQLESVAAALLDSSRQRSASSFVGPRDSFRSTSFEDKNNHLADDTEQRRHGHVFGFEPGGEQIGAFRSGKLSPAQVSKQIKGTVINEGPPGLRGSVSGPITVVPGIRDQQGRPVMFAKPAAEAFAAMMVDAKAQGNPFRGSDIASTYRTPEKNKAVGGASKSLHMRGLAADIHGSTGSWIRQNGAKYGWVPYDYPGTHGGHFEFVGGFKKDVKEPPKLFKIESKNKPSEVFNWDRSSVKPIKSTPDVAMNTSYSQNGMVAFENNTILYQKEFVLT
jgi:hypothetical protein